jgi:hypothetical protein
MAAKDYCAGQYDPTSGPITSSLTHVEEVTPDDDHNLAFLPTALINNDTTTKAVAVLMASGEAVTLYLLPGIPFPVRPWRVLDTGTEVTTGKLQAGDCRTPSTPPAET